jgi:hypothetical protein
MSKILGLDLGVRQHKKSPTGAGLKNNLRLKPYGTSLIVVRFRVQIYK